MSISPATTMSGDRPPLPRGVMPSQPKQYNDVATETFGPLEKYVAANDNFKGAKSWASGGVVGGNGVLPAPIINRDYVVSRSVYDRLLAGAPVAPTTNTTADFMGAGYADDDSPVVPELSEADWQRHAEETSFAFQQAEQPQERGQYIGLSRGRENHRKFVSAIDSWRETTDRTLAGVSALAELPGYVYLGSPYSKYAAGHDRAALIVGQCAAKLMSNGLVVFSPIAHGHSITICGDLPLDWAFWKRQCDPMIDGAAALVVLMMEGWWDSVGLEYEINRAIERSIPILYIEPAQLGVVEALTGRGE